LVQDNPLVCPTHRHRRTVGQVLVAQLEVGVHRVADWEKTILAGYEPWRQLRLQRGGVVEIDLASQSLLVS
jgi:hypothetical protein